MSELDEVVYCDALRVFIDTLVKKGGLSSEKAARWMNDALGVGDEIDFMDTSAFREYQAWIFKDIFSDHADEWEQLGINTSKYVVAYIDSNKEHYYLPEYFVDFDKLPEGITANQFLKSFTMKEIFGYLEDQSCWGSDLPLAQYGCRSAAGVFVREFLTHGGSFNLLLQKFTDEIGNYADCAIHYRIYVPMAIDLKDTGLPVDLTAVATSLDSPLFLGYHRLYDNRRYIMDTFDLMEAGAEVDLKKLATKVKKAKASKKINYDEYLKLMQQLFEFGYDTDFTKFAKSILKDLAETKAFKHQFVANCGHIELLNILEDRQAKPEILDELRQRIGVKY